MSVQNLAHHKDSSEKQALRTDVGVFAYGKHRSLPNLPPSSENLFLCYVGEEWCEAGYLFDTPREEYHLHFVLEGKGVYNANNKSHHLKAGDMFLVRPKEPNFYQADAREPWHYMWVTFGGSNAWFYLQKSGFSKECSTRKANTSMEQYIRLVHEILKYSQLTYTHSLRRMSIFYEILSLLIKSNTALASNGTQHIQVAQAIRYAQNNYLDCTVAKMAEYAGITRNYLFTLFKQELRISPLQYLTRYRMEKAASLLANTESRVCDIANAVGYEDPLSFSKVFKKTYKTSPLAYRKTTTEQKGEIGNTP